MKRHLETIIEREEAGWQLFHEGRHAEAIEVWRSLLRQDPMLAEVRVAVGMAYLELGDADTGMRYYRDVLDVDPGHRQATLSVAIALIATGDRAGAAEMLRRLERDSESGAVAYGPLARLYLAALAKDYDAVLAAADEALAYDPDAPDVHTLRAAALCVGERYAEAMSACLNALRIYPASVPALDLLLRCAYSLDNYATASSTFERVVALDPKPLWRYHMMFQWDLRTGRLRSAWRRLKQAISAQHE